MCRTAVIATVLLAAGLAAGCTASQQAAGATAQAKPEATNGFDGMPPPGTKAVCPVMGDELTVKATTPSSVYKGRTYVFCCPDCKPKFDADPGKYVK